MEFLSDFIIIACVLVLMIQLIRKLTKSSSRKLPPGPKPLPVIGNVLDLKDKSHRGLAKLSETYGPLMHLQLGQVTTVVVSSTAMAREVMQKHDRLFADRAIAEALKAMDHHEHGMGWLPISDQWRKLRKISNIHLFTPQRLDANEGLRRQKVQAMLARVEECSRAGKAVDIGQAAFTTTLNLLSNTFFSLDLSDTSNDPTREIKDTIWSMMAEIGKPNLADYFPVLRRFDPQGIQRQVAFYFEKLLGNLDRIIEERVRLREKHGVITSNDMLDVLLNVKDDKSEGFAMDEIRHILLELFVAGNQTTSVTLEWAMAELIHDPKSLAKARAELEKTIGKGKPVTESDIMRLPYLQAVVKETLRMHPPVALIPRKAATDVEINGFTVPKDAQVIINAWAVGRDPTTWENPNCFMPERFLGSDIDFKGGNHELIPFGGGRRICPGISLANRMLYMMLGSLVNSFDWKLENGMPPESLDMADKFGFTVPKAQRLEAVPVSLLQ